MTTSSIALIVALLVALTGAPAYQAAEFDYHGEYALTAEGETATAELSIVKAQQGVLTVDAQASIPQQEPHAFSLSLDDALVITLDGETETLPLSGSQAVQGAQMASALVPYLQNGGFQQDAQTLAGILSTLAERGIKLIPYSVADGDYYGTLRANDLLHAGVSLALYAATDADIAQKLASLNVWEAMQMDGEDMWRYASGNLRSALSSFAPANMDMSGFAVDFYISDGSIQFTCDETIGRNRYVGELLMDENGLALQFESMAASEQMPIVPGRMKVSANVSFDEDNNRLPFDISLIVPKSSSGDINYMRAHGLVGADGLSFSLASNLETISALDVNIGQTGLSVSAISSGTTYSGSLLLRDDNSYRISVGNAADDRYSAFIMNGAVASDESGLSHDATIQYSQCETEQMTPHNLTEVTLRQRVTAAQSETEATLTDDIVLTLVSDSMGREAATEPVVFHAEHTLK